jgi:UDPglucose--hexose-1-phosphate uridylyltransferase
LESEPPRGRGREKLLAMNEQGSPSLSAPSAPSAPDAAGAGAASHEPQPVTRVDALTGNIVIINANRQKRPNLPSTGCPFCPGGVEAPEPYDTRWFKNRWPQLPEGKAEVLLYSPIHDASFASLGIEGVAKVIEMWSERFLELGARPDVAYVLEFENRGPEVGATISHPHGQIYAFDTVPPFPAHELGLATCAVCDELATSGPAGELNVASHGDWVAWVPSAAVWPYELRIAPRSHVGDIPSARPSWNGFAAVLVDALSRLDRLFSAPMPYMLWIHQKPTDGGDWPMAHLHVHVTPLLRAPGVQRFVASAEQGAGVYLNPVPPEVAAENLRNC